MAKLRVSDHIFNFISRKIGKTTAFTVAGGGNMFLVDSVARNPDFDVVCCHHEQACAMASVGYSKLLGVPSIVIPTTGCAGTNVITGLLDAWQDSVPMLCIAGQVNASQTSRLSKSKIRKFGVQEADLVSIVSSITKYSALVSDASDIRYHMERAIHECITGRFGCSLRHPKD